MAVTAERIAERLATVRERTLSLIAPLDDAGLRRRPDPIMSPPIWDLGHIGAYEELWVARRLSGRPALHPELDALYDAFETPRPAREDLPVLGPDECRAYLDEVRARTLDALATADLDPEGPGMAAGGFVFELVAEHEAQHTETVLQAMQMLPPGGYAPPGRRPLPAGAADGPERILVPAGAFAMGAGADGFAYDCERPRHEARHGAFWLDRLPVTAGRHLAFMADGGYARPELWSPEGWAWRRSEGVVAPLYWEPDGAGGWLARSFDRLAPVDPERPVCHVSCFEAEAHARWAGARLPTEVEWERAAAWCEADAAPRPLPWGDAPADGRANLDQLAFGVAPAGAYPGGAAPCGAEQLLGDVWEWTATAFTGYPGFRAFPYPEYAEVFFGSGHRVLRGGSWATQPCAARTTFRNWDLPQRRQIFAGFRLARDA